MQAFVNDSFLPIEKATLHVGDLAIQRGFGIFDFFRVQSHVPLYLKDYLDRFYKSASMMGLQGIMPRDQMRKVILELIARNNMAEAGIKMILTGGYSPDAYTPVEGNFVITQHGLSLPTAAQVASGIRIITHEYRRDLSDAKTINYTMGVWLQKKVKERNADDVLYHQDGVVSEFPRCNFFLITKDETVVTPSHHILHGITRMKVLQAAREKFKVEERNVTLDDLKNAKEAFLTSTTKRILPIIAIDDVPVGTGKPGAVTLTLTDLLSVIERKEIEAYQQALVK
ncbi:MAG: aminotransferase class IV [Cytophagales bacterium]|nr:aminotransferase class IV [Cytophagales bacterium]